MKVSAQYAETHFSQLISAAYSGEEVRIASPDKPGLRLVMDQGVEEVARRVRRKDLFGAWEGKITLPTNDEWRAMDKEIEVDMVDGPIFQWSGLETAAGFKCTSMGAHESWSSSLEGSETARG